MDQRLLPSVTLDQALEYASANEKLQKYLQKHFLKIVGGRLEPLEFHGVRVHLTVEENNEEKIAADVKEQKKKQKKSKEKKEKRQTFKIE